MRKLLVLYLSLVLFTACSIDDDTTQYTFEILPVESVIIPDEFAIGQTYPISVSYYLPTNCHAFKEFYYFKENNERTVAPVTYVFEESDCQPLEDVLVESTLNFIVTSNGSYIFKFWQGEDIDGEDQYLIIEVPVTS